MTGPGIGSPITSKSRSNTKMKHLKIAGLCLVPMLVVGMALAGNASAALLWLLCLESTGLTKYSNNQCTTAKPEGKWQSLGLCTGCSDTIRLLAFSLILRDKSTGVEVECPHPGTTGWGLIEGPNKGKIKEFTVVEPKKNCDVVKGSLACGNETLETVMGRNLPWNIEIFTTENKSLTEIKNSGAGEFGWLVKCGAVTDECMRVAGPPESFELLNGVTEGILLVLARFESKAKPKCSIGGEGKGEIGGLFAVLLWNGNGLSINPF
jgi:hypothetical protein